MVLVCWRGGSASFSILLENGVINFCLLGSPSTSIKEINARQSLVGFLHARPHLRDDILQSLGDMEDASRIVQKFILGRGDATDLSAIHSTILIWASIKRRIELEKNMKLQLEQAGSGRK